MSPEPVLFAVDDMRAFITVTRVLDTRLFFFFIPSSLPHPKHRACLLKEYLLSACNVLGTVLGAGDAMVNKAYYPILVALTF